MSVSPLPLEDPAGPGAPAIVAQCAAATSSNTPPVAADDFYAMNGHQQLGASVLANDVDAEGDPLSVALVSGPGSGTLALGTDGLFTYTPDRGFDGVDTFTYTADDGQADSNAATVSITVTRVSDAPPAAVADEYRVDENQTLSVAGPGVLANDADADGDKLSAILVTGPRSGILVLGADGSFDYTPNAEFHGADSFTYRASDGQADSDPATVAITVDAVNGVPTATDDAYSTPQDQPLAVPAGGVLANDLDADGDPLSAVLVTGPASGVLTLNTDGSFEYAPNAGFVGADSFTYRANDGQADSNPATVAITVDAVNSVPTAADDAYSTQQDQPLAVPAGGVLANDLDADGDPLSAVLVTAPASGTLTLNSDGSFEYAPNAGLVGADSFTYAANDGQADSNPATVAITVSPVEASEVKELKIHLEVSGTAFGPDTGPIWSGSTFWVSAYVEDLREAPQGVVGGAIDVGFDPQWVTPTGNAAYGEQFTDYRQGTADAAAGAIDEAGALTTEAGVGVQGAAPFVAWEFRRSGPGAPSDPNSQVAFAADPGEGTATILPGNFALVGLGTPVDWKNVEFDAVDLGLYLGDFNGDGAVNHCDLALWIPQAPSSPESGNFDPKFDLNGDLRADAADLAILMPRLYQPVLGDGGDDLDWVGSIPSLRHHKRDGHRQTAVVDRVLQGYDRWCFI